LLTDDSASATGVEVRYQGDKIRDPYLATIYVENTGRHAVTSSQFDKSRPVVINLGKQVKAVSKLSILPDSNSDYAHAISGTTIQLGPDLLNPGQALVVQLITEGRPEIDELKERFSHHLSDTRVEFKERPTMRDQTKSSRRWVLTGIVGAIVSVTVSIIAFLVASSDISASLSPDNGPPGAQITLTVTGAERFALVRATISKYAIETSTPPNSASANSGPSTSTSEVAPAATSTSPNEYVTYFELLHGQADKDGHFNIVFTMPEHLEKGSLEITVSITEGKATSFKYLTFFVH
jgi:hypothetical protein